MMTALDTQAGTFTFTNPYDDAQNYPPDGVREVVVTWAQLKKYAHSFVALQLPAS
jgi:hypothetical protein